MVSYAYQDYFYKTNMQKDILVVDKDATVTAVSGHEPSISGATYVFTTEDFKSESFELEESLCSEEDLKFGLCEAGFVRFEVKNNPDYPNLKDREVELKVYMYFNGDSSTLFQIGTYIVEKDEYSDDRRFRSIEMYDFLFYLRDYDITPWYNNTFKNSDDIYSVKQLRDSLFDWLNSQELGEPYSFPQETITLVNDNFPIGRTIESDIITFDFFMQGLLELNGCMGHVDRTGQFVYKSLPWYSEEAVKVVTDDWREPPTKYEDITTIGIGFVDVYDENNILKASFGSTSFKHPSRYAIVNSFVFADKAKNDINVAFALVGLRQKITHLRYKPCEVKCQGNLCLEVGDQINVQYGTDENDNPLYFYTYILERSFKGIQSMRDVYSARGNKRQPAIKLEKNSNWQVGTSNQGTDGTGNGGVSDFKEDIDAYIIEIDRNKGFRYLDEPSSAECEYDKANGQVKLKWTDPSDLTDSKPVACNWAKTYVVRRENQRAMNIYQGTVLKTSTTRDEHSSSWFVDNTIEKNKRYYYSIMPCDTKDDVRWTKCFSVNTNDLVVAPTITDIHMDSEDDTKVVVEYSIPSATYSYIKLVYKKDGIPASYSDGTAIDITQSNTSKKISGIADGSTYYFVIFTNVSQSEEKMFTTVPSLAYDVNFFTDSFNNELLVDDWDITHYEETRGVHNPYTPSNYSADYLSNKNFFIGNDWIGGTQVIIDGNELRRNNRGNERSDCVFWIPINRINANVIKITADYRITNWTYHDYDYFGFFVAYVDDNNGWHSKFIAKKYPTQYDESWYNNQEFIPADSTPVPYIDYIGLHGCDSMYHARNIVLTVVDNEE